jgi:hypothetical protein
MHPVPDSELQPLIRFAMWHLMKGESVAHTIERFQATQAKRQWPPDRYEEAIRWAIKNISLTQVIKDYLYHNPRKVADANDSRNVRG